MSFVYNFDLRKRIKIAKVTAVSVKWGGEKWGEVGRSGEGALARE